MKYRSKRRCPCGAVMEKPCANPNCHLRTGRLPGGGVAVEDHSDRRFDPALPQADDDPGRRKAELVDRALAAETRLAEFRFPLVGVFVVHHAVAALELDLDTFADVAHRGRIVA